MRFILVEGGVVEEEEDVLSSCFDNAFEYGQRVVLQRSHEAVRREVSSIKYEVGCK